MIDYSREKTHLSLGDVRSADDAISDWLEQFYADNLDSVFDAVDRLETIQGLLGNVLTRHGVRETKRFGCISMVSDLDTRGATANEVETLLAPEFSI